MHLKSLKIFCDVVYRRSFSRAAEDNGISQSGVSQVVTQLEHRVGVKLIDRSKRPFALTPEGEMYYEGCRKIVDRYFALEEEVRSLHGEVAGRVRVAAIYSVGLHHMSRYVQEYMTQYPKANVRLEYLHPHRVYDAVENDQADIGLVSYPKSSRTIKAIQWREEPMVLACAPTHRFAGRDQIALDELNGEPVVGFDSDLTIRREIDRALSGRNTEARVVMAAGTLVALPLSTGELVRPLGILHRRGKELGVTVRRFIELLRADGKLARQEREERKEKQAAHETVAATNGHECREVLVAG
jgi:DNA-binding transcriptional LysR family regulator